MREQLDQLIRIYNTLLTISTRGEDTVVMGQCIAALKDTLVHMQEELQKNEPASEVTE